MKWLPAFWRPGVKVGETSGVRRNAAPASGQVQEPAGAPADAVTDETVGWAEQRPREVARKLDRLFAAMHPRGRGAYSEAEVVEGIAARGGPAMEASALRAWRTGEREDVTLEELEALTDFFGLTGVAYFYDAAVVDHVDAQLELLAALRDSGVQHIHVCKSDSPLSPAGLRVITAMVRQVQALEAQRTVRAPGPHDDGGLPAELPALPR